MPFSEDDDDLSLLEHVNNYHFVDEKDEPTCFSVLPFQWEQRQSPDTCEKTVFLHGDSDDGLQKIYKQVTTWRLDFDGVHPTVYVLSKDKKWIQLMKPRKSFEDTIRKIMITVQCIHYLKRNAESTERSLWDHVRKAFSHLEVRASHKDILEHAAFIRKMIEKEDISVNSMLITSLLSEKTMKNFVSEDIMNDKNSDFINDEDETDVSHDDGDDNDGSDDDDADGFDSVCAICDEGGNVLCCEGKCLRSFHPTKKDGIDSDCVTLGYTKSQVDALQNFQCLNCRYNQHQCFACGKLGSSNASNAEVFICANVYCGHFYHPNCVAKLLYKENETKAAELEKMIAGGQKFICPFHKCVVCKKGEDKNVEELQFAMCRRCPTSYHRKCLPREIEDGAVQRAWFDLLPFDRILIYCMQHKIDKALGTPIRDHLVFPEDPLKKKLLPNQVSSLTKRKIGDRDDGRIAQGLSSKMPKLKDDSRKSKELATSQSKKVTTVDIHKKPIVRSKSDKICVMDDAMLYAKDKPTEPLKRVGETVKNDSLLSPAFADKKTKVLIPEIDKETEKRVRALVQKSSMPSLTLENFIKTKITPTTHVYTARHVDKTITLGKVEGSIEAIQTALQKIEEDDGNTENAKDVCEPGILEQIMKWRNKLGVYLGPFLHGMLYTSFGRHFTKIGKLKEIVEKLHWYVQNGDMMVDFCCGANDFSMLMKEKLEATGKKCQYRNYDVITPRNDFNFFKKDWMKVRSSELTDGSQLIMGLNPPFGLKAALANKFIDKALEFKPKLLILIVPKETQRLDEKKGAKYDLIWEDEKKLSGKAFYLPGTVDVNDKQLEQWNIQPPPLYLWSRFDWTARHMDIAMAQGHKSKFDELPGVEDRTKANTLNKYMEDDHGPSLDSHLNGSSTEKVEPYSRESDDSALKPDNTQDKNVKRKMAGKNTDHRANKEFKENTFNGKEKKSSRTKDSPKARELNECSDMSISPPREVDPRSQSDNLPDFGMESLRGLANDPGNADLNSAVRREIPLSSNSPDVVARSGDFRHQFETSEELFQGFKRDVGSDEYSEKPFRVEDRLGQGMYPQIRTHGLQGVPDERENLRRDIRSQIRTYGQQDDSSFIQSQERLPANNIHSLIRTYGQQEIPDPSKSRYNYGSTNLGLSQANLHGTSTYHLLDPVIRASTIDRYAPRLDEANLPSRVPGLGSSAMERYTSRLDEFNSSLAANRYASSSQTRWNDSADSISFTTRHRGSFSPQGPTGWLDD